MILFPMLLDGLIDNTLGPNTISMRVSGNIPKKVLSFEGLLKQLLSIPESLRHRIFKTIFETGYMTDGQLLSRLTPTERDRVEQLHWDTIAADRGYASCLPVDLREILPLYVGEAISQAKYVGGDNSPHLVFLSSEEERRFVEARQFVTLQDRHPNAQWYFAGGKTGRKKPVVLLERDGFMEGTLLGALAVLPLEDESPPVVSKLRKFQFLNGVCSYPFLPVQEPC